MCKILEPEEAMGSIKRHFHQTLKTKITHIQSCMSRVVHNQKGQ